ncbi:MAG: ATP-binding cassette domain-containing protein, partial [Deltaproteobacteria bacterium]
MTVIDAAGPAALLAGCTKEYEAPDRQVVVGPLDLRVDRGDYVAITGPSGSGKTTFLSILGALDRPSRGRATIGGIESSEAPARVLARLRESFIGFVFQQYHLFARRTALENVLMAFGPPPLHPGEERVAACVLALERVGLGHRTQAPAGALSGGEQQRVAIARALVKRP